MEMAVVQLGGHPVYTRGEEVGFDTREPVEDIARIIKAEGYDVPTRVVPNWVVRILGWFDPTVALVVPHLGRRLELSNERARALLDWRPRPLRQTILDTAADIASRMAA